MTHHSLLVEVAPHLLSVHLVAVVEEHGNFGRVIVHQTAADEILHTLHTPTDISVTNTHDATKYKCCS